MGGDPQAGRSLYRQYFYWYNIAHEVSHVLRRIYASDRRADSQGFFEEETAVNQLAVAYWRAKGHAIDLLWLENQLRLALLNIPDPVPPYEDRPAYVNHHFQELSDPTSYAHLQFNMVVSALDRPLEFSAALQRLVSAQASDGVTIPISPDLPIDENLPYRLVEEMRKTLQAYNLPIPEVQVVCMYAPAIQFVTWE
jgi:hypothetical protein